jgi:hypothetical protein
MPHLSEGALKVMEVLKRHRALDLLQIASRAEISVSQAVAAVEELAQYRLNKEEDGVYSLDANDVETVEEPLQTVA